MHHNSNYGKFPAGYTKFVDSAGEPLGGGDRKSGGNWTLVHDPRSGSSNNSIQVDSGRKSESPATSLAGPSGRTPDGDAGDSKISIRDLAADSIEQPGQIAGRMVRGKTKTIKGSSLPPVINATPTYSHTMRFAAQTSGTNVYNVTGNNLAGAMGSTVYVANTTGRAFVGTARIKCIKIWPSQDQSAIANVADVRWLAGISVNTTRDVDLIENLPLGITNTKCVSFVPPKDTLCGFWLALGTLSATQLFAIECSEGSIIDVVYEATLANNTTGATIAYSGVTAAIGVQGFSPLNGSGGGLLPLGVATVF